MNQIDQDIVKCGNCGEAMGEIDMGSDVSTPRCKKCVAKNTIEEKSTI
ncbi:hypothetical protein [Nitrosopumilus sp. S4]